MEEAPSPGWSSTNRRHEEPYGWKTNIGVGHTARLAPRTPGAGAFGHHRRTSGSLDRPFFSHQCPDSSDSRSSSPKRSDNLVPRAFAMRSAVCMVTFRSPLSTELI
jgi:hypothetical protein